MIEDDDDVEVESDEVLELLDDVEVVALLVDEELLLSELEEDAELYSRSRTPGLHAAPMIIQRLSRFTHRIVTSVFLSMRALSVIQVKYASTLA